jgi:NAD+ diphosphatase
VAEAGAFRRCPACSAAHFPRTDPAVIMLVTDDVDRCLLGHNSARPPGWFSTLAGFVEPGETPEDAVAREVHEEVGVRVGAVTYAGSQPWPFPSSLMLGYFATATSTSVTVDGDEISDARWFSREALATAVKRGEVGVPTTLSIAGALITAWYGAPLPDNVLTL